MSEGRIQDSLWYFDTTLFRHAQLCCITGTFSKYFCLFYPSNCDKICITDAQLRKKRILKIIHMPFRSEVNNFLTQIRLK